MKKILFTALLTGLLFICSPFAYAEEVSYQVDVGSFDIWKNSAGQWIASDPPNYTQAYKPGDAVEILPYKIPAPEGVTGVKSVKFAPNIADWELGDRDVEYEIYNQFFTIELNNINYTFSNNALEVSYRITLKTPVRIDEYTGKALTTGESRKKEWQSQTVEGYRYYLPILIEWEKGNPPDFYPTPRGATEWKPEFLTYAKIYTGQAGDKIEIPVTLHNIGSSSITDFACTWYGSGWANPVWTQKEIAVEKGQSLDFTVPVTIPQPGQETRLVFRANIDGKTPKSEINQDNNSMIIIVRPEGFDIAVELTTNQPFWLLPPDIGYIYPIVKLKSTLEIEHEFTIYADGYFEAHGTWEDFQFIKFRGKPPLDNSFSFRVTAPGIYKVKGCIPAFDAAGNPVLFKVDDEYYQDIDPSNNCDEIEVEVRIGPPVYGDRTPEPELPEFIDDDHIRIGLTG